VNPAIPLSRRTLLAAATALWSHCAAAADTGRLRIAAPADVIFDYGLFLAGREVSTLRSFAGPHARRDVMELALLMREIRRQIPAAPTELVPIDSYQRALFELRSGRISALGTTVWQSDLAELGGDILPSAALLQRGEFVVGLFAAPANRKALAARTLPAVRELSAVSNSDWSVDWATLHAIGLKQLTDVKTWRQMVMSVARQRADVLLAPFPAHKGLLLEAEGVSLQPLQGVALALQGSRHLAASRTQGGLAIADKVFPALAALAGSGGLQRAYRECGFINPRTSSWLVLNA
jgi:hypothetical protein